MTITDYAAAIGALDAAHIDYVWSRTGSGGHMLTTYGPFWHAHYRRDGSAYAVRMCMCWE